MKTILALPGLAMVTGSLLALSAAGAQAQPATPAGGPADPVAACAAFRPSANFSDMAGRLALIPDAPTNVISAAIVPAERGLPEICRIEAQIAPTIGVVIKLPTQGWNGKMVMGGCGGPCGRISNDRIDPPLARHYAVVTTDMGHRGAGWAFGYQNLQGLIDFGSRSTHLTAVVAKAVINAYYGRPQAHAYFDGCSTGGRQSMIEAQRFPQDFDGIYGGSPPYSQVLDTPLFLSWGARANMDAQGKPILDSVKLPMIHKAVMDSCQTKSDAALGVLLNPGACAWDPKAIVCKAGADAASCLTPAEADVVRKIYTGATDSKGKILYFGMARGSELNWAPSFVNTGGKPGDYLAGFGGASNSMVTYATYFYSPGPTYKETDFDYDRDPQRVGVMGGLYDALNPDLRAFKQAGGKFILYHGWNDNQVPPGASLDYYETVTRTLGGPAATRDFFRLFMLPGGNHCTGGPGGSDVDWLTAIENWVEKGQAPDRVVAYAMKTGRPVINPPGGDPIVVYPRYPLPDDSYARARPVYPYPAVAEWNGKSDPAKAESWRKAQ